MATEVRAWCDSAGNNTSPWADLDTFTTKQQRQLQRASSQPTRHCDPPVGGEAISRCEATSWRLLLPHARDHNDGVFEGIPQPRQRPNHHKLVRCGSGKSPCLGNSRKFNAGKTDYRLPPVPIFSSGKTEYQKLAQRGIFS